jgi:2-keto-4-pentenoate hydratase/2-oxohepta-3-ene-1,7-dioic acid hydratase in catechol pathway
MKIVRFTVSGHNHYGVLTANMVQQLNAAPFGPLKPQDLFYELDEIRLLSPCKPSKIVAIGINYCSHASEFKHELPDSPLMFLKPATAVIGPEDNIVYPSLSKQVDFEGELGIVIRKKAHAINPTDAFNYILGYTCFNDVTARDLQKKDGQWTRAKGFDTFAAIGPWIETELDTANLKLETRLNGVIKQSGTTADLIFPVAQLVSAVSQVMTLLPGDLIASGTPSGVGPMQPGDTVEIQIDGIGSLINHVSRNATISHRSG